MEGKLIMSEKEMTVITVKILNLFHDGTIDKYVNETYDVEKAVIATQIAASVGFDLVGHPDFWELKDAFDKTEHQGEHTDEEMERLADALSKIAYSSLGKSG